MKAASALEAVTRLFFPPRCIFCGDLLGSSHTGDICACRECLLRIELYPLGKEVILHKVAGGPVINGCDMVVCACKYNGIIK